MTSPSPRSRFRRRARARSSVGVSAGRLVEVDRRAGQLRHRALDARPVLVRELAGAQVRLVHAPERGNHAQRQLLRRHFHAEDRRRHALLDRGVLGDVHGERRLAHRRASRDHDEVAGLQAGGLAVELREAGRHAAHLARVLVQRVEPVDRLRQDVADRDEARTAAAAALGDLEHAPLGLVHEFVRGAAAPVGRGSRDLGASRDELPQDRALADDLGIGADVGRGRRVARDRAEVGEPADLLEPALALEVLGDRDGVAGPADLHDLDDRLEDEPVVAAVEVRGHDDVGDRVPGVGIEHQPAEHGLLRLDRVGRRADLVLAEDGDHRPGSSTLRRPP